MSTYFVAVKAKKIKVALWGFSTLRPFGLLYSYPQKVPAFIFRGATHHTDARDLYQRRRELLPMNFASKSVIHENSLCSFTCRKAGTWDIFFYFPSEGRHTEDFPDARKIQRLRPGLNPRTRVPVASMLTTRPPKPSRRSKTYASVAELTLSIQYVYCRIGNFSCILSIRKLDVSKHVWRGHNNERKLDCPTS